MGAIYKGKVVSIKPFGAFVEIAPGKDGLVHISKLDKNRVEQVEDVVSIGDEIIVKVMEIKDGKISLSMKQALPKEQQHQRKRPDKPQRQNHRSREPYKPAPPVTSPGDYEWQSSRRNVPSSFEDMMSKFKQTSEDKMSDLKRGGESRGYSRRGNGNGRK